eukprot:g27766.t1
MYAQAIRVCMNTRFISHTCKVAQNITQAQCNATQALKTNHNIVMKPADKGGAIIMQNRTDYCKEVYRQLNNQEPHRLLPANLTKEHTHELNRQSFRPRASRTRNILVTMDVSALYTTISHGDGIAASASVLNTNNCQFPDAILQLICFILNYNIFTFDNQFFIQTHGTAMGTGFSPQYANIFMRSFQPKHTKKAIPYKQALHIHRTCSDEEQRNRHLSALKDALIRMRYGAKLIDRQFRRATAKNRNDLLRRQTWDITNKVPFVIQCFPRAEKLHHVLCSLQHVIDNNEHLAKIFPTPPLLAFKQLPNFKQTIVCSKLPSLQDSIDHNTIQPCHGNLCKTYQIINMDTTITHGNTTHHMHGRYS